MTRYEFIDSIIQNYSSWFGDNMEPVCKNCAKKLQRAGFGRSDVQEYFAKDGIYNKETGEGTWDKEFVDCVVSNLPINSSFIVKRNKDGKYLGWSGTPENRSGNTIWVDDENDATKFDSKEYIEKYKGALMGVIGLDNEFTVIESSRQIKSGRDNSDKLKEFERRLSKVIGNPNEEEDLIQYYAGRYDIPEETLDEIADRARIHSSRKISSSQKGFENVAEGTKYDDYHIDTKGMGILSVENIIEEIEGRGNQAVLTVKTSDGSTNHSQFGSKDWKEYKDSVNNAGNAITDVWVTEVEGGSYVRNSRRPIKSSTGLERQINRVVKFLDSCRYFVTSFGTLSPHAWKDKYSVEYFIKCSSDTGGVYGDDPYVVVEKLRNAFNGLWFEVYDSDEYSFTIRCRYRGITSSRRPIKSAFTPDEKHSIGNIDFYDVEGSRDREGNTFSCGGDLGDCWADSAWYDCDTKQLHFGNAYFNSHRDMTDEDAKDYFSETISYYLDDGFNGDELVHDFCEALYSSRQIKSARYIATDPESGEVLGSADTYEEAVNEWGEDVTITDSEVAEGEENMGLFQSRRPIKSSNVRLDYDGMTGCYSSVLDDGQWFSYASSDMDDLSGWSYGTYDDGEIVRESWEGLTPEEVNESCSRFENEVKNRVIDRNTAKTIIDDFYDKTGVSNITSSKKPETTKQFVTRILSELEEGEITEDEAAEEIAEANNVNIGYAKQILSSYIADKDRYITSGMLELGEALNVEFDPDGSLDSWSVDFATDPEKPAPTLGGELVRAARYIISAFRDDGEKIGWGYAREMLNPAARFIEENTDFSGVDAITDMLDGNIPDDESYRKWIDEFEVSFADYLRDHEEFFHKLNKVDFTENTSTDDEYSDITEFYVEDEDGNKYWFSGDGEEYTCDTIDYATDPDFTVGDVITAEDYPYDSIDFDSEFGDFTEEPFDYSWEDGNGESVTISDVRLIGGMFDIDDFVSANEIAEMIDNGTGVYDSEDHELKISDIM